MKTIRLAILVAVVLSVVGCMSQGGPRKVQPAPGSTMEQAAYVQAAVARWNAMSQEEIGQDVFEFAQGDVTVNFYLEFAPCSKTAEGCGEPMGDEVWIRLGSGVEEVAVTHELGHILGYKDRYSDPVLDDDGIMGSNCSEMRFSENDRLQLHILTEGW